MTYRKPDVYRRFQVFVFKDGSQVRAPWGHIARFAYAKRNPVTFEFLRDLLCVVGYEIPREVFDRWTMAERADAEVYAVTEHFAASDNTIRRLGRPYFLPEPWQGEPTADLYAAPTVVK